jgi:hypothetical protein
MGRYALLVLTATCLWFAWREYDFRKAARSADMSGAYWVYDDPFDAIKADWRAAFVRETWNGKRWLSILNNEVLARVSRKDLVARLRPRNFSVSFCDDLVSLGDFKGVGDVMEFSAYKCENLKSIDALRGSTSIEEVYLIDCPRLENLDVLKSLPKLRDVVIQKCDGIPAGTLAALKAALPHVQIAEELPGPGP